MWPSRSARSRGYALHAHTLGIKALLDAVTVQSPRMILVANPRQFVRELVSHVSKALTIPHAIAAAAATTANVEIAPHATPTGPRAAPVNHDFKAPKMMRIMLVPSCQTAIAGRY